MMRLIPVVLVLAGCFEGGEEKPRVSPVKEKPRESPAPEETATLTGKVHINGIVRPPKVIGMDPACGALHPGPVRPERVVVDEGNNVRWAFVWVKRGLEGKTFPLPVDPVILEQEGCRYTPHVFGIRVGQALKIRNGDPLLHNIHGLPFENQEFNFAQPVKGQANELRFLHPEVMVKIKCDVHSWMGAWAGVLDHPFFAVTDESGSFAMKGLPAGRYTLGVWQEDWSTKEDKPSELEVELKGGETRMMSIELERKKE